MSEHDREISGRAICPRCLCQFQHHSRPQLYECLVEQAIDMKRKPGLPVPGFRILPPRPPNVAALLDEEASLPAAEVGAVVAALITIAQYGADGICPYGCDCPSIASNALAALDRKAP